MKSKIIFFLLLFTLTISFEQWAGEKKQSYKKQVLNVSGKVTETVLFQMGESRGLLVNIAHKVIVYKYEKKIRKVYSFRAPYRSSVFDVADINADKKDDIAFYDGRKISFYIQKDNCRFVYNKAYDLTLNSSLPGSRNNMNRLNFLQDLDLDKKAEIIFPATDKIFIYRNIKDKFTKIKELDLKFKTTVSDRVWKNSDIRANNLRVKVYIPKLYKLDINSDGYPDFYASRYNKVYLFMNDKHGSLENPIIKYFKAEFKNIYASYFSLKKLDADNYYDAIFTIIKGSGVDIHTENYIFKGKKNLAFERKAIEYKESGGFFYPFTPKIKNSAVLISPKIDIGLPFVISYLIQNKLRIRINQLRLGSRKIEKISSYVLSYKVAGSLLPGFAQGDFDGDAQEEFAVGINPDLLYIYKAKGGSFSEEPFIKIKCKSYGIFRKGDIDANGKEDLIIVYPKANSKYSYSKNRITIIYFQ